MRRTSFLGILVAGLLLALFAMAPAGDGTLDPADQGGGPPTGVVPDNYIVTLQAGASSAEVAAAHGLTRRFTYSVVANGFAGFIPPGKLNAVQSDSRVQSVTADRVVNITDKPADPGAQGKGGATATSSGQVVPPNITRVRGNTTLTGAGVGIAIVDTGSGPDDDLNRAAAYFDAFGGNGDDGHGHGTHVAGIAAAKNNTVDVLGVAYDATVYSVRVLDSSGSGSDATVIAGLDWIAANAGALGIRVANASLGRRAVDAATDAPVCNAVQAVVNANVTFTAAAGNDPNIETTQHIPSGCAATIAVASTTAVDGSNGCQWFSGFIAKDTASYFTTDGVKVLVSTPGEERENINPGCLISSVGVLSLKKGGGTTRMSGTSMAAPHVAGLAALLAQNSGYTVARITCKLGKADRVGVAPLNSPTSSYTFDGEREGIGHAPTALADTACV